MCEHIGVDFYPFQIRGYGASTVHGWLPPADRALALALAIQSDEGDLRREACRMGPLPSTSAGCQSPSNALELHRKQLAKGERLVVGASPITEPAEPPAPPPAFLRAYAAMGRAYYPSQVDLWSDD